MTVPIVCSMVSVAVVALLETSTTVQLPAGLGHPMSGGVRGTGSARVAVTITVERPFVRPRGRWTVDGAVWPYASGIAVGLDSHHRGIRTRKVPPMTFNQRQLTAGDLMTIEPVVV